MRLFLAFLLLPLCIYCDELRLQIKAKFLPLSSGVMSIEISSMGEPRPILIGIKPTTRKDIRMHCIAVERDLIMIKRLLAVSQQDCDVDFQTDRITLANHAEAYTTVIALIEVPISAQIRVVWNGRLISSGPVDSAVVFQDAKPIEVELKGLDSLI